MALKAAGTIAPGIGVGSATTATTAGFGATQFLSAAGTGLTALGAYSQGQAAKGAAEFNAQQARQQSELAMENAQERSRRKREDHQRSLSRMRAQYSAQGLATTGVVTDMLEDTAGAFELEIADIFTNAQRVAGGLESSARLYDFEGDVAGKSGGIGAFSALTRGGAELGFQLKDKKKYASS